MDKYLSRDWYWLLDEQHGVVARSQAQRNGITKGGLEHRLGSGQWKRLHWGVYAAFTGEVTRQAKLWAAVQRAGPGAVLSYETAAEVQGLADRPSSKIHITVPSSRRPAQHRPIQGVVLHRSACICPQRLPQWELPRTRIEDTVFDLVAVASSFDEAYSWISRALSRELVDANMLRDALARRKRIRWRVWLAEALAEGDDGIHFPLERRYARDVERAHGLPKAQHQARRTINGKTHYKDNWYPGYGVCVELDGAAYHPPEQIRKDKRRDNDNLAVDDARTYRFDIVDVTERACNSAAMVAASLRRGGWQGRLHPCRRPGCGVGRTG
jgi:hypothetical protein